MSTLGAVSLATVGGRPRNIDDASLVYHINLFVAVFLIIVVLAKIPRAFALFGTSSEWYSGHFLRYTPYRPSNRVVLAMQDSYPPPSKNEFESTDDSHTLYTHNAHLAKRVTAKGYEIPVRYPPHIASCFRQLRPLLSPLRARIIPGMSVGQALMLITYFYCLVYATFYRSNVFTDSARTGWIAIAQLPLLLAFAQKNNTLGSLLGYGYEKLNFLHRFVGRMIVLSANVHALHYFYKWSLDGTFKQMMKLSPRIWGMVALLCFDMILVFSTAFWRSKSYNLFLVTHIFGYILAMPACYYHKPATLPYIIACLALYGFDHLFRILKTRIRTASIRPLPELDCVRLEVPSLNIGWRAGQHVRIRVLSLGMGWWGWTESHPFTIASVSGGPDGLVLLIKKAGTWTKRLLDMAKLGGYLEGGSPGCYVKVIVEGPYGGVGHTLPSSFSSAVFVAGGSGITYAMSSVQDLIKKDLAGESRVKSIDLIWTVPDPQALVPLRAHLTALIHQSVFTPLRVCVYYTRAPIGKFPFKKGEEFVQGLSLAPGRPRFNKVFEGAICKAVQLGAGMKDEEKITGLFVGVCGPTGLADEVVGAVNAIEGVRRDQVGGVEVHEEVFGW